MSWRCLSIPFLLVLMCTATCCKPKPSVSESLPSATQATTRTFDVQGTIISLKPERSAVVIEHEDIPGYMNAMTMPFSVRDTNELNGLIPGEEVKFTMIVTHDDAWIEGIEKTGNARNLLPPDSGLSIVRDVEPLEIGDTLPDYSLTNEFGAPIHLSQYRGKTLALAFLFTRCPLPTFCPRTARQLAETQQTLLARDNGPTHWQILVVTIDPEYDTPERLKQYGKSYDYHPDHWTLATGDLTEITALGEQFGIMFWREGGTISHNLRTVVVDPDGIVQAILIGNEWKVEELVAEIDKAMTGQSP